MKNVVRSAISKEIVKIIPLRNFQSVFCQKEGKGREEKYLLLEFKEDIE